MMLLVYPNGSIARSDTAEGGCIIVKEPPKVDVDQLVVDQTNAVLNAMTVDRNI